MPRGRVPKGVKTVERKIQFPEKLDTELQLLLFSEFEQRVPYGALTRLVVPLVEEFLRKYRESQANGTVHTHHHHV